MPASRLNRVRRKNIGKPLIVAVIILAILGTAGYIAYGRYQAAQAPLASYIQDEAKNTFQSIPVNYSPALAPATTTTVHIPIIMYHYVEHVKDKKDILRQKLNTNPETLDLELKTMQDAGYTFLTMSEVNEAINNKKPLPKKPVVLTFDDGYKDFYTDALPILQKHQVKATAYIITGFIGKPNYMSLPQLTEVKKSGLIEIGAHTVHHIDLKHATLKQAEDEIKGSKVALEKLFGEPVTTFAYPSGRFNEQAIQVVKEAGFTTAVSTMPGTQAAAINELVLFRLRAGGRTGKQLLTFLELETAH
jgi:peptidoglycan/xylan/chitin deacetylase (PgdA/CDA1 family)